MNHLLKNFSGIEKKLSQREILLLLDYDGTLTPIVEKPELAILSPEMKKVIEKVSKKCTLGIISGRSLKEVKNLVNLSGIYYSGNHGLELEGPEIKLKNPEAERIKPIIQEICLALEKKVKKIKGALVENKGLSASLHYRLVSEKETNKLKKIFEREVNRYISQKKIKVTSGKKVWEIRPNIEWDKGKAVKWLIKALDKEDFLPIYLGDDQTDEDAFLALKDRGITILVSEKEREREKSQAKYFLKNVEEVKKFLRKIISLSQ